MSRTWAWLAAAIVSFLTGFWVWHVGWYAQLPGPCCGSSQLGASGDISPYIWLALTIFSAWAIYKAIRSYQKFASSKLKENHNG